MALQRQIFERFWRQIARIPTRTMGAVTFLAPASPQWLLLQLKMMNVLRRSLGNESPFGWCDFVTSKEPSAPSRNSAIILGQSSG